MKVHVGTSGWYYNWNPDLTFDWYLKNSKLNSIELNASFYRYPYPNQVKSWFTKTNNLRPDLRWSVKINRLITHVYKFNETAWQRWKSFERLFKPLDKLIDFYLFQLPPSTKPSSADKIAKFCKKTELKEKFALEWRNIEWFKEEWIEWTKKLRLTLVSVDAPDLPRDVFNTSGNVYLRMHGRTAWYSHNYTNEELKEVVGKILKVKPRKIYVYFNNDHSMVPNARKTLNLLKSKI
jgi:uncharacterized protein YecE (DUF72 family)